MKKRKTVQEMISLLNGGSRGADGSDAEAIATELAQAAQPNLEEDAEASPDESEALGARAIRSSADANMQHAALKLGMAMLMSFNLSDDVDAEAFVDDVIAVLFEGDSTSEAGNQASGKDHTLEDDFASNGKPATSGAANGRHAKAMSQAVGSKSPIERAKKLPTPMRANVAVPPEADYQSMSAEQFSALKKQLARMAGDGRRVRL